MTPDDLPRFDHARFVTIDELRRLVDALRGLTGRVRALEDEVARLREVPQISEARREDPGSVALSRPWPREWDWMVTQHEAVTCPGAGKALEAAGAGPTGQIRSHDSDGVYFNAPSWAGRSAGEQVLLPDLLARAVERGGRHRLALGLLCDAAAELTLSAEAFGPDGQSLGRDSLALPPVGTRVGRFAEVLLCWPGVATRVTVTGAAVVCCARGRAKNGSPKE